MADSGALDDRTLLENMIQQVLRSVEESELFDHRTLEKLTELAERDGWQKVDEIVKALDQGDDES